MLHGRETADSVLSVPHAPAVRVRRRRTVGRAARARAIRVLRPRTVGRPLRAVRGRGRRIRLRELDVRRQDAGRGRRRGGQHDRRAEETRR